MMNYKQAYTINTIRERTRERAERVGGRFSKSDAVVTAPSFALYVRTQTGREWPEVKPYARMCLYNEYKIQCVEYGMMYEHPKLYDLTDTI